MDQQIGIHSLIEFENKYLIIQRSKNDHHDPLAWDLAGGGLEGGENIYRGLRREIFEEAGLKVGKIIFLCSYYIGEPGFQLLAYEKSLDKNVKVSFEHEDFKWIEKEEFLNLENVSIHVKASKIFLREKKRVMVF